MFNSNFNTISTVTQWWQSVAHWCHPDMQKTHTHNTQHVIRHFSCVGCAELQNPCRLLPWIDLSAFPWHIGRAGAFCSQTELFLCASAFHPRAKHIFRSPQVVPLFSKNSFQGEHFQKSQFCANRKQSLILRVVFFFYVGFVPFWRFFAWRQRVPMATLIKGRTEAKLDVLTVLG